MCSRQNIFNDQKSVSTKIVVLTISQCLHVVILRMSNGPCCYKDPVLKMTWDQTGDGDTVVKQGKGVLDQDLVLRNNS